MHPEHIGHGQVIVPHSLLGQFTVEAIELIQAGRERSHHVAKGPLPLLPVDEVTHDLILTFARGRYFLLYIVAHRVD